MASVLPSPLAGSRIFMVGIKGTGMCALAELLVASGATVSGSDVADQFYTDRILTELRIPVSVGFEAELLPEGLSLVVHSAAYGRDSNPQLLAAAQRGIPIMNYPEALGALSRNFDSSGIAGVHGKTTTTALAGVLIAALGLPARVLAGSAVGGFGDRSTLVVGNRFFVAETCEYRRHFLHFSPRRVVLTSVESDHQDFYPTYGSIRDAFADYVRSLPEGGLLIYCADDGGATEVAASVRLERPDLRLLAYGRSAAGSRFRVRELRTEAERTVFALDGFPIEFRLRVPGEHIALDAVAALALTDSLLEAASGGEPWTAERLGQAAGALENFRGSRRRSELVGEARGVLVMDDYGHHPTAIRSTLRGLKTFYPGRRLVVSFMSHTYSRTAALLDDFAASLEQADLVYLHKIYGSAREHYEGGVDGRTLFERAAALGVDVRYFDEPLDALADLLAELRAGDLFLTMGAGDNWKLGRAVLAALEGKAGADERSPS